jgi:hypothetical protein
MQNLSLDSLYMLYDRTYMQSPRELFKRSFCDQLIIFLISCFVLQAVSSLFFGAQLVNDFVGFGYNNLNQRLLLDNYNIRIRSRRSFAFDSKFIGHSLYRKTCRGFYW